MGTVKNRQCTGTYAFSFTQPPLLNSCNNPRCHYLNPGQCAEGTFNCQGIVKNKPCKGTYDVSRSQVALVDEQASKYFMEEDKRRHRENPEFFRAQEQYMREREQEKQRLKSSKLMNYTGLTSEVRRAKQRDLPQSGLERKGAQRGRPLLDEHPSLPPTYPLPPILSTQIQEKSRTDRYQQTLPPRSTPVGEYPRPPPACPLPVLPPLPTQIQQKSYKDRYQKSLPPLPTQTSESHKIPPPPPSMWAWPNPPRGFASYNPAPIVATRYHMKPY